MIYKRRWIYPPKYEYVSTNQHGDRYKKTSPEKVNVVELRCNKNDAVGMSDLIALGHMLNVPVHYDFTNHQAFIEVISAEDIQL